MDVCFVVFFIMGLKVDLNFYRVKKVNSGYRYRAYAYLGTN